MRSGVRVTLVSSLLLAAGAACDPIEGDRDDYSSPPIHLFGNGGAAGRGGGAGGRAGGAAGAAVGDLLDRLRAIDGVADVAEVEGDLPEARSITFTIAQPVDHANPALGAFKQRVFLLHRDAAAPTVLESTGYQIFWPTPGDSEPSFVLRGNAITVEHRFFGASTPLREAGAEPPARAWAYLTIEQAAADHHRLIEALKPLYAGAWISTGVSKGGMTSLYHRRFYPDDVVGTVAYVAPNSFGTDDLRYPAFLERVGDAACRERIVALQRDALARRAELLPLFGASAAERGLTYEAIGAEQAFEHIVQEARFAFWQYGDPEGCAALPAPGAPAAELLAALDRYVPLTLVSDQGTRSVDGFAAYFYQAATQLGSYGPLELHLEDLLRFPRSYSVETYSPAPGPAFDAAAMLDVGAWIASEGEHIIFVYGEYDPWSAGAFDPGEGRDLHVFVAPKGNHNAYLTDPLMPAASAERAFATLRSWAGVAPRGRPSVELAARPSPAFHRPPAGLPL